MTPSQLDLSFESPPLKEVSFSVQFEPIEGFHIGLIGLIWDVFKSRYPSVETADELAHEIEKFGVISRRPQGIQFLDRTPVPRIMFISDDQQYLIQLQKDRFIFNWRQLSDESVRYPRYQNLKNRFLDELQIFGAFLAENHLEPITFNQVEFTYVNHIDAASRSIQQVFTDVIDESRFSPSLVLESFSIKLKHLIQKNDENIGRLYTSIEKGNRISDGGSIYILNFMARTHPIEPSVAGVVGSMDIMRQEINSCFSTITTKAMHEEWKRHGSES